MAWYDDKSPAVDPDNPTADEQITAAEWNAMRLELRNRLIGKDVDDTNLADNRILVYDLGSDTFVFEDQNEITELNDIPNVIISGVPADNEVLAYDNGTSKWINQTAAEALLATTTQLTTLETAAVLEEDFDATTFLYATADNTPLPKTRAETMAILSGTAAAEFLFNTQNIGGIVDPTTAQQAATKNYADTQLYGYPILAGGPMTDGYVLAYDATNGRFEMVAGGSAGAVLEADFDATTFLYATADNTPLPKTRAETMAILSGTAAAEFLFNTQNIGGIVDPTTAQQASTKNYADTTLFTKEAVTAFTDGYIPVYRTASGKFEMEIQSAALGLPVADTSTIIKGSTDGTKLLRFEVGGFTSGNTRIATFPDKDFTVCGTDEVMLLSGTQQMAGDLNMGNYDIIGMNHVNAYDGAGVRCISNASVTRIDLATTDYAFQAHASADMNNEDILNIGRIIIHDTMELTIASGVISVSYSSHTVDTEADAATDDLDTINGGTAGMTLMIRAINSARTIVAKNGTGNLLLEADRTLDNAADTLSLYYDGSNWLETGFANNGA